MAFRSSHSIKYKKKKKNASPRRGTVMNIENSIKSGSQMRNACFYHPSLQDSVFLHWCFLKHILEGSSGFWCTDRGGASSLGSLPPTLVLTFLCPQLSTHWICPVGSPRHHVSDDKPKSNFKVCCSRFSSVWIWLFSYKHGTFLSQAWRGGYKVLWLFFEKENLPYFCPILASNRVQKQLPK